jgi:hypothetical protein
MVETSMKASAQAFSLPEGTWAGPPVAVFWDQSLVWGLICLETLEQLNVPFHVLSGKEIASGGLDRYRVLVVPGGWASHKVRALGEAGSTRLKLFLRSGGSYLGFCGGAGLALSSPPSIGLVPQKRMPLSERLPNASGQIRIQGVPDHPIWDGLPQALPVSIWWPSQFAAETTLDCLCLATYEAPGEDFWVADLRLTDLQHSAVVWEEWEKIYGINLAPKRLLGHPAMIEVGAGKGRLILSYPHLDTPGDAAANLLYLRCLQYLDEAASEHRVAKSLEVSEPAEPSTPPGPETLAYIRRAANEVDALIAFGERHLLWTWRLPWLLNWRRGIRGLEYGTLAVVMAHLLDRIGKLCSDGTGQVDQWVETARKTEKEIVLFCRLARNLLIEEKLATQSTNLTKLGKVNATVDQLRGQLFGNKMNHGGLCRELFDELDGFLLKTLRITC